MLNQIPKIHIDFKINVHFILQNLNKFPTIFFFLRYIYNRSIKLRVYETIENI